VCFRDRGVEAAHTPGSRGMSQKADDTLTIPLCSLHHKEQHRIGWKRFIATYELNLPILLAVLTEKPKLFPWNGYWWMKYRADAFRLCPLERGIKDAWNIARGRCREVLIEAEFEPVFSFVVGDDYFPEHSARRVKLDA
jgi:hypothetical protein